MRDKLRNFVESLFEDAPKTKQIVEIKEEILQNTIDKYDDLIKEGKSEEAAFNIAVAGIGDVGDLLNSLRESVGNNDYTKEEIEKDDRRSGIMLAVSIMLYILSVVPTILLSQTEYVATLGPCLMFTMIAAATGLIIYRSKTGIHYNKKNDTIVENFKEWNNESKERKSLVKSVNAAISAITLALYFIISFTTGAWYITWILFLISAAVQNIVKACFELKK